MDTFDHIEVAGRTTTRVTAHRLHRVQAPVSEDELGFIVAERRRLARATAPRRAGGSRLPAHRPSGGRS